MQHQLSSCPACASDHLDLQKAFPVAPYFVPDIVTLSLPEESEVTHRVLHELNMSVFDHKFTDSAIKHCGKSEGIALRKSVTEQKKYRRTMQRKFRDTVNEKFAQNAGLSFLAENESISVSVCHNRLSSKNLLLLVSLRVMFLPKKSSLNTKI